MIERKNGPEQDRLSDNELQTRTVSDDTELTQDQDLLEDDEDLDDEDLDDEDFEDGEEEEEEK